MKLTFNLSFVLFVLQSLRSSSLLRRAHLRAAWTGAARGEHEDSERWNSTLRSSYGSSSQV